MVACSGFYVNLKSVFPLRFVFKRGVLGSIFIVFVKVIIWVNSRLVHCWAGGRHFSI